MLAAPTPQLHPNLRDRGRPAALQKVDDRPVVSVVPDAEVRPVPVPIEPDDDLVVGRRVAHQQAGARGAAGTAASGGLPADEPVAAAPRILGQVHPLEAVEFFVHGDPASDSGSEAFRCGCEPEGYRSR